jgi:hypothetical protein
MAAVFLRGHGRAPRMAMAGAMALLVVATYLSHSRGAWLALSGGALVAGWRHSRRLGLVLTAGAALCLAVPTSMSSRITEAATLRESSARQRLVVWRRAAGLIADHPWGLGLGTAGGAAERLAGQQAVATENWYLHLAVETGVPVAVAFAGLTAMLLIRLHRASRQRGFAGTAADGLVAAGVGLVLGTLWCLAWYWTALAVSFWSLAGMVLSLDDRAPAAAP